MFLKNLLNIDNIYAIHLCLKQMSFKQLASLQNLCQHYVDHSKTHNITDIYSGHYFKASLIQKFDNHTKTAQMMFNFGFRREDPTLPPENFHQN